MGNTKEILGSIFLGLSFFPLIFDLYAPYWAETTANTLRLGTNLVQNIGLHAGLWTFYVGNINLQTVGTLYKNSLIPQAQLCGLKCGNFFFGNTIVTTLICTSIIGILALIFLYIFSKKNKNLKWIAILVYFLILLILGAGILIYLFLVFPSLKAEFKFFLNFCFWILVGDAIYFGFFFLFLF